MVMGSQWDCSDLKGNLKKNCRKSVKLGKTGTGELFNLNLQFCVDF